MINYEDNHPYHLGATNSPTPRGPLERFAEAAFDPFRHAATAPVALNNNSFGLATGGAQQVGYNLNHIRIHTHI